MAGWFATPEPEAFVHAFGVEPVFVEETQWALDFSDVVDGELRFSYDVLGRSVALTWRPPAAPGSLTVFREGAALLRVVDGPDASKLVVEFRIQHRGHRRAPGDPGLPARGGDRRDPVRLTAPGRPAGADAELRGRRPSAIIRGAVRGRGWPEAVPGGPAPCRPDARSRPGPPGRRRLRPAAPPRGARRGVRDRVARMR